MLLQLRSRVSVHDKSFGKPSFRGSLGQEGENIDLIEGACSLVSSGENGDVVPGAEGDSALNKLW